MSVSFGQHTECLDPVKLVHKYDLGHFTLSSSLHMTGTPAKSWIKGVPTSQGLVYNALGRPEDNNNVIFLVIRAVKFN